MVNILDATSTIPAPVQSRGLTADQIPPGTRVTRGSAADLLRASVRTTQIAAATAVTATLEVSLLLREIELAIRQSIPQRNLVQPLNTGSFTATGITDFKSGFAAESLNSRVNILLDRVDAAVAAAGINGVNLVSSTSRDVILRTTAFGGTVIFTPRPIDSAGLDLQNIDLSTVAGRRNALSRIETAIVNFETRQAEINDLARAFTDDPPVSLSRGSLVNILA